MCGADRQEHPVDKFPTQHLDPMRSIRLQSSNGANRRGAGVADRGPERPNSAKKRTYGEAQSGGLRKIACPPRQYFPARPATALSEAS